MALSSHFVLPSGLNGQVLIAGNLTSHKIGTSDFLLG
jgi:hypothetical protein